MSSQDFVKPLLNCFGDFEPSSIVDLAKSDDKVVIIRNPFVAEWWEQIAQLLMIPEKFYILSVSVTDNLIFESSSISNYAIPIITDLLIDKEPLGVSKMYGFKKSDTYTDFKYTDMSDRAIHDFESKLKKLSIFGITASKLKKVYNIYFSICKELRLCEDEKSRLLSDYLFCYLPNGFSIDKKKFLIKLLESQSSLDEVWLNQLLLFLGKEED